MTRINTEYITKLQDSQFRRANLATDQAIFKEEMQKRMSLEKELDEME